MTELGDPPLRAVPDPVVEMLVAWRVDPSEAATIALCDRLRTHAVRESEVLYLAQTIERLHGQCVRVLLALGRFQMTRGLLSQAQRTFVLVGHAEGVSSSIPKPAAQTAKTIPMVTDPRLPTHVRKTSTLLLDVLCKLDDDEAISAVARTAKAMPPPLPTSHRSHQSTIRNR